MNYFFCCISIVFFFTSTIQGTKCEELKEHEDYWKVMQGGVDWDPAKGNALRAACDAENPCYQLQRHDLYWSLPSRGGDHDPARRAYLEEKCNPGAAARRELAAKIDAAKNEIYKHVEWGNQHGRVDSAGRHYDHDPARGRMLLENLRALDPAAATELAPRMLPDPICADLAEHTDYWKKNGILKDGKAYDKDYSGKGQRLLAECRKYSPAFAVVLQNEMLPLGALEEWKEHVDYWTAKGNVDIDPARGDMLYKAARLIDPKQADEIKARAPKNLFEYTGQFLKDLAEFKIPQDFKLKGKISDQIKKIPPLLDATAQAIAKIPDSFITMYTELGVKKFQLRSAIDSIVSGKKVLVDAAKDTNANPLVPQELKDDLTKGFDATAKTLPEIERVLTDLYNVINTLVPSDAPQPNETPEQYKVKIKDAAFARVNQEIQPSVNNALNALNSQYQGLTLSQGLERLATTINEKNL